MVSYDRLVIESRAFQKPTSFKALRLTVPEPELSEQPFDLKPVDTGGAAYLSASANGVRDRILLWEFTEEVSSIVPKRLILR